MRTTFSIALISASLLMNSVAYGSIFTNPITGAAPNSSNPYTTGQMIDPNVSVSGIGRGTGINPNAGMDRYNANSWNTAAIDLSAYFTWTITPTSGFQADFLSFVYTGQATSTGPTSFAFRSSVDSFVSNIGTPTAGGATIPLSAAAYQDVNSAIEFRLYAWGASATGGTFSVNNFTFNGTVERVPQAAVPEVSALATWCLMLGAVGLVIVQKKLR
jgi:hypothetical protein